MHPPLEQDDARRGRQSRMLLALLLATAGGALAIFPLDRPISEFAIRHEPKGALLDGLFRSIKAFGKADVLIAVLFAACLTRLRRPAVHGLVALALITVPVHLLKFLVERERPWHSGGSFPSGDTASVVAAFLPIALAAPRLALLVALLAVLVACFRVVASYHYPSDVLAGAAIGCLAAWVALRITPRKFLAVPARVALPLFLVAVAVTIGVAATSASNSPSSKFVFFVLPLVVFAVLLERRRIARIRRAP
jgi:membrane-associated phospholipid phosphatase